MDQHERFLREAISAAHKNPESPFGTVLVDREAMRVVADGVNRSGDHPALHGEMDAIHRHASARARTPWHVLDLYTTAEPCPMCQAAILWAGIGRVIYGTSIPRLRELGWKQIDIRAEDVVRRAPFAQCEIHGGVLASECDDLFRQARVSFLKSAD